MSGDNKRRNNSEYDIIKLINFFEELGWLIDSNKELNFKNASKLFKISRNVIIRDSESNNKINLTYSLIGVLPSLLKDEEIFQNNYQLVQFAEEVLSLNITRWGKRSRNEIIGLIICEVEDVNKARLDLLIKWADGIIKNKNRVKVLQSNAKNSGHLFSWNETIQKLFGEDNE